MKSYDSSAMTITEVEEEAYVITHPSIQCKNQLIPIVKQGDVEPGAKKIVLPY